MIMVKSRRAVPGILLSLFLPVASCGVKEDRSACPADLTITVKDLPSAPADILIIGQEFDFRKTVLCDTTFEVRVPNSGVEIRAVSGASARPDGSVLIPQGFDSPPVYLFRTFTGALKDTASVRIVLRKHFCTMTLRVDGPAGLGEPYWAQVHGSVSGLSAWGEPIPGEYSYRLDAGLSCRLPRQRREDRLWLDIVMPDRVVRSFALDNYLLKAGYDWTAWDLSDIPLTISLSVTALVLQIGSLQEVIPIDIVI